MGRQLISAFSNKKPNEGRKCRMKNENLSNADETIRKFQRLDVVWVRNYANGPKWVKGTVEKIIGPVSYKVTCPTPCGSTAVTGR